MSKAQRQRHRLKTVAKEWTPFVEVPITDELRAAAPFLKHVSKRWVNSRFVVDAFQVKSSIGGIWQLSVARHGLLDVADYDEMECIRLELFGPEYTAIQIHSPGVQLPSKVRALWIMPADWEPPCGLNLPTAWGDDG